MKLLVVSNLFPNRLKPTIASFNACQIQALAQQHDVQVVVPVDWHQVGRLYKALGGTTDNWEGVPVEYVRYWYIPRIMHFLNGFFMLLCLLPALWRRRQQYDAIYATWAFPDAFAAILIGRLLGKPVVAKVHGTDVEIMDEQPLRGKLTAWALRKAHKVVAVSQYLAQKLVKHGVSESHINVVYNGIDKSRFESRAGYQPAEGKRILYVGNLKVDKGICDLLKAVDVDFLQRHEAVVQMVGFGPDEEQVKALIAERGLSSQVTLMGKRPHAEVAQLMREASILCLPSYHEGMPNVVIEALATGLPVVATAVGGIPEIITADNGLLISQAGDIDGIHKALDQALTATWDAALISQSLQFEDWTENARRITASFE